MFTTTTKSSPSSHHVPSGFFKPYYKKVDYAILSAMSEELEYFRTYFRRCKHEYIKIQNFVFSLYEYNTKKVLLANTGLGTTFASSVVTLIYGYFSPAYILFSGTAGAINKKLKLRDVIIAERAFEAEIQGVFSALKDTPFESCLVHPLNNKNFPKMYLADEELLHIINEISFPGIEIHRGTVVSSNTFPAPQELFDKIKSKNPYTIDMETSALYQIAWLLKARVLAIRGVSNVLNHDGTDDKVHESDVRGSSEAAAKVVLKLLDALSLKHSIKESSMNLESQEEVRVLIQKFNLKLHPEGGYYARIFESTNIVKSINEKRYNNEGRNSGTSIYYLLQGYDFSAWHRLKSDEIWHFYKGSHLKIYIINKQGRLSEYLLGDSLINPAFSFQIAIPADNWFAAELIDKASYCLIGCTVTPGFEFQDFELANRDKLSNEFPDYSSVIKRLTRIKSSELELSARLKMYSKL